MRRLAGSDRDHTSGLRRPRLAWRGLLVAVASAGVATGIGLAAGLEGQPGSGALYLAAVVTSSYVGGLWAGLLCAALAWVGFEYFFLEPSYSFDVLHSGDVIVAGVLFLVAAIGVARIVERLRETGRAAEKALAERQASEERLRAVAKEQEAVARLGRRALAGRDLEALFGEAVDTLADVLGTRCVELLRATPARDELTIVRATGLPSEVVQSERIAVLESTIAGLTLLSEEPVGGPDAQGLPAPPGYLQELDVQSSLAVPVRGAERPWGVLAVHSSKPDAFSRADVIFTRAVANVLGAAVLRREAEEALRETRDELEALIEASPIPIVAYDPAGIVTLWNPAAERVFGWTAEEATGRIVPFVESEAEMLEEFHSVRERVVAGHAFSGFETVRRRKDGTLIDVSFSNAPIRDAGGRIRGVVALVADVTDRKRTERELREGAERLRLALEASQMGTWEWDIESGVVTWSDEIAPMHGLEPGAFDGTYEQYETLIYPDDREFVRGAIEAALERGAGYDIEFRTAWPDGTIRWISGQGQVLRDHTGKPARMVGLARDVTERKRREDALAFAADVSEKLSSLDYERTVLDVARLAVPRLADCCVVDVFEGNGDLHQVEVVHVDPAKEALVRELEERFPANPRDDHSVVGSVLRSRQPLLVADVDDRVTKEIARNLEHLEGLRRLRIRSLLVVPLVVRGETIGALTLLSGESGRRLGGEDVTLASALAHQAAVAIDNSRLYRQRSRIASTLQRSLLPPDLPEIPGVELAARYFPAGEGLEVGGDFYDAFQTGARSWAIDIGDVCGKGSEAAAVTGLTRHTLRAAAIREPSPASSLAVLNEALRATYDNGTFCTVVKARLHKTGFGARLTFACGGHPLPLLVTADGHVAPVGRFGSLVGFFEDPEFTDTVIDVHGGDVVFFYTDGLVEGRGRQMDAGEQRLHQILRDAAGSSAEEIARRVEKAVVAEERGVVSDDTAFLVVRVSPRARRQST